MSMHYRGVTYNESSKSLETTESDVVGHYRGASWKIRQPKHTPAKRSSARLKYRGQWVSEQADNVCTSVIQWSSITPIEDTPTEELQGKLYY